MEVRLGYKQTEVGVIPEDWEVKDLGSILNQGRLGGNYPNQDMETNYPLMKMGNIGRGNIDLGKIEYISTGQIPDEKDRLQFGDLLFNTRNTLDLVGKVAIWRNELPAAYYNSNLMRLEFNPEEISSNFFANYVFNSNDCLSRLRTIATGTTSVAAIYKRDLLLIPFPVPSKSEQEAIAAALSDVDALIRGLDQLIAKKRDLKQTTMQQLLTGKLRLPGFCQKPGYKQTEVGVIPEDWEVKPLGELIRLQGGYAFRSSDFCDIGVPVIRISDIQDGNVNVDGAICHPPIAISEGFKISEYDVLIAMSGATTGKVGVYRKKTKSYQNQRVGKFVVREEKRTSQDFVAQLVRSFLFRARLGVFLEQGAQPNISASQIESLLFAISAEREEQAAIATVLSDMDAEIAALEQRRDKTRDLKQGMMQELLIGRIRLV